MSTLLNKGGFYFSCKTSTGKTILCLMKTGETVKADFDKLEINYSGTVRVLVQRGTKKEYVTLQQLLPAKEEDNGYFDFVSNEIKIISNKRKAELKAQQRAKAKKRRRS